MDANNFVWAKASADDTAWLPLWLHLRDTFQISGWIWENRIPQKHKQLLQFDLGFDESKAKRVYQILCGLHDLGKSTPDFSGREYMISVSETLYLRMKNAGFSFTSFRQNRSDSAIRHEISSEFFIRELVFKGNKNRTAKSLLSIIAAHHGKPVSLDSFLSESLQEMKDKEPTWFISIQNIYEFIMEGCIDSKEILVEALNKGISWRTQMIFSGYLSMADWLASSEDIFPLWDISRVEEQSWTIDSHRLKQAVSALQFPEYFDSSRIDLEISAENLFAKRFGFSTPRPSQKDLVDVVQSDQNCPNDIFILEAPMGEGKTEAALISAEILMKRSGVTGIFFGMPTMATGEAIYSRVKPYLDSILQETDQNATLELMHSKAFLSNNKKDIDKESYFNKKSHGLVDSGWLSGRYLKPLNSFVVGTVDSFLMMQLPLKYTYWRHLGFSQKVIIIDEVHAMDEVMKHYLIEALRISGFYGCPVILCSATLKEAERKTYLDAYQQGKDLGNRII